MMANIVMANIVIWRSDPMSNIRDKYLADPGKARGCSTDTFIPH